MVHGGINIYRLKDNATRIVLVRVFFIPKHAIKAVSGRFDGIAAVDL